MTQTVSRSGVPFLMARDITKKVVHMIGCRQGNKEINRQDFGRLLLYYLNSNDRFTHSQLTNSRSARRTSSLSKGITMAYPTSLVP